MAKLLVWAGGFFFMIYGALLLVSIIPLGMAAGRVMGMFVDGAPNVVMYVYLVAEVLFGLTALALCRPGAGEVGAWQVVQLRVYWRPAPSY